MSIVRQQPTRLVLLGRVVLTLLVALTQTAFTYQDQAKESSETLKESKLTQTAFTYQGQLKEGSVPANGTYTFRFALYTGQSGGHKLGVVIKDDVVVTNGSFTVQLDFGSDGFSSNESWLEVGVRPANSANPYTALSPRQRLTPTRNAILAQAEPWRLIGVPLGFPRSVDIDPVPVDKIADQSVTGERIADGQVVKSINFIKDSAGPAAGDNATVKPSGSTLPPASQESSTWTKAGTTVRLSTSTDNVGIGTTRPIAKLDVAGVIHASEAVRVGNSVGLLSSGSLNLIEVDSNPLAIGFSNPMSTTPNPVAFSTVRVGIGTTSPTHTLDINGRARIRVLTASPSLNDVVVANPNGVLFTRPASTLGGGNSWLLTGNALTTGNELLGTTNNFPLRIFTNNTEKMRILTNGNVGIGTANPAHNLTVFRAATPGPVIGIGSSTAGGRIAIATCSACYSAIANPDDFVLGNDGGNVRDLVLTSRSDNPSGGAIRFATGTISGSFPADTEKMRITQAGNLGIGTITPNEQLEITGNFRLPASTASVGVIKSGANRFIHNFGVFNFFAGVNAGNFTMATAACCNTAVGHEAFQSNTTGVQNVALGRAVLKSNTTGSDNTAIGTRTLENNTTGRHNTAVGGGALFNNVSGQDNIALGSAGNNLTTGSFNIYIGNGVGIGESAAESNTIRIGGPATGTRAFIGGIRGVTTGVADAIPVLIDSNGQLGTQNSSRRFKEHIEDMGAASEVLYRLRPVSFLYKREYGGRTDLPQFGLIAEDVAKVAPKLVSYDDQGKPYTVYYQFLVPMLLNEMQKKDTEIEKLRARLDALEKVVEGLTK